MNKTNVQHAINIMQRVIDRGDKLDMTTWQELEDDLFTDNEDTLHTCGTAACFAGWVAVSPEFQASGGSVSKLSGAPFYGDDRGHVAIALWLDIPVVRSSILCKMGVIEKDDIPRDFITPEMVIQNLQRLLDGKDIIFYSDL